MQLPSPEDGLTPEKLAWVEDLTVTTVSTDSPGFPRWNCGWTMDPTPTSIPVQIMDPIHIGSSLADGRCPRGLLDFFESMNDPSQLVELVAAAEYQLWDDAPGIWFHWSWDDGGLYEVVWGDDV